MRKMLLPALLSALASVAAAQPLPTASEILKQIATAYSSAKEYEIVTTSTGTTIAGRVLFAFRKPNSYKMDGDDPDFEKDDGSFNPIVLVHDGTALWLYRPKSKDYVSFTGRDIRDDLKPEAMDEAAIGRFKRAAELPGIAKVVRADSTEIAGAKVDCYVLTVPVSTASEGMVEYTWWVEKKTNHVVREDRAGSSVLFSTVKLNEPLPDDLFKFTPPAGTRQMGGK